LDGGCFGEAADVDAGLLGEDFELLNGCGAAKIAGDKEDFGTLFSIPSGEFTGGGRLSGTIESAEEDAQGAFATHGALGAAEHIDEGVVEDFDEGLAGLDALKDFGAEGAFFDFFTKFFGNLVVDVGTKEGEAYFAKGGFDVAFRNLSEAAEVFEYGLEFIGEGLEHGGSLSVDCFERKKFYGSAVALRSKSVAFAPWPWITFRCCKFWDKMIGVNGSDELSAVPIAVLSKLFPSPF
jgi:hypothetical protein